MGNLARFVLFGANSLAPYFHVSLDPKTFKYFCNYLFGQRSNCLKTLFGRHVATKVPWNRRRWCSLWRLHFWIFILIKISENRKGGKIDFIFSPISLLYRLSNYKTNLYSIFTFFLDLIAVDWTFQLVARSEGFTSLTNLNTWKSGQPWIEFWIN
jgi:hypothetical protein